MNKKGTPRPFDITESGRGFIQLSNTKHALIRLSEEDANTAVAPPYECPPSAILSKFSFPFSLESIILFDS